MEDQQSVNKAEEAFPTPTPKKNKKKKSKKKKERSQSVKDKFDWLVSS